MPSWLVSDEDRPETHRTINAETARDAAELWAEEVDAGAYDYTLGHGRHVTVFVEGDGKGTRWRVVGETVARFTARAIVA